MTTSLFLLNLFPPLASCIRLFSSACLSCCWYSYSYSAYSSCSSCRFLSSSSCSRSNLLCSPRLSSIPRLPGTEGTRRRAKRSPRSILSTSCWAFFLLLKSSAHRIRCVILVLHFTGFPRVGFFFHLTRLF